MSELWQLGALELAEKIRNGDTTSREVLEAHLARVDAVNPHLNAIVRRLDDEARAAADAADRAVAEGAPLGSLHGVPCTVKENIDLAGTPTTQGVPALADAVAPIDAPTVARMRAAGAIPFARTNLPDLGLRVHTDSTLHGLTRNPWNPNVTAGGSSGGEASAIASGMSPIGLGNDIGGSLRNPAHCCGIASIKPTAGVVPIASVVPPEDHLLAEQQMLGEGPMARHVADVRAALEVLAGWSPRDPRSVSARLTDLADGEHLTVAVMADPPGGSTHPEIAAAVRRAADLLADQGHDVVDATPPSYEQTLEMWAMLLIGDLTVMAPFLDILLSPDALSVRAHDDRSVPHPDAAVGDRTARQPIQRDPGMVELLRAAPGALVADLGAAGVRTRRRPAGRRSRHHHARHVAPGAARQPARDSRRDRAVRHGGRPPGRRAGDGRPVHRPALPGDRRTDPASRGRAHPDRSRHRLRWADSLRSTCPAGRRSSPSCERVWSDGDAAFPVDQRLPIGAKTDVFERLGAGVVVDADGRRTTLDTGRPVEPGDAIVVATSGSSGIPKGVVLTHDAVAASAAATSGRLGVGRR